MISLGKLRDTELNSDSIAVRMAPNAGTAHRA